MAWDRYNLSYLRVTGKPNVSLLIPLPERRCTGYPRSFAGYSGRLCSAWSSWHVAGVRWRICASPVWYPAPIGNGVANPDPRAKGLCHAVRKPCISCEEERRARALEWW